MDLENITSDKSNITILRVLDRVMPEYLVGFHIIKLTESYYSTRLALPSLYESLRILQNEGFVELKILSTVEQCHEYNRGIERIVSRQSIREGDLESLSDEIIRLEKSVGLNLPTIVG